MHNTAVNTLRLISSVFRTLPAIQFKKWENRMKSCLQLIEKWGRKITHEDECHAQQSQRKKHAPHIVASWLDHFFMTNHLEKVHSIKVNYSIGTGGVVMILPSWSHDSIGLNLAKDSQVTSYVVCNYKVYIILTRNSYRCHT